MALKRPGKAGGAGRTAKAEAAPARTTKQAHRQVASLLAGSGLPRAVTTAMAADESVSAARATGAAAGSKAVSFHCTNAGCLVSITSGTIHFVFSGTGGATFPAGVNDVFYAVRGPASQAFSITVEGGALDFPIDSTLSAKGTASGMRELTVKG